jgi:hypothetical protein
MQYDTSHIAYGLNCHEKFDGHPIRNFFLALPAGSATIAARFSLIGSLSGFGARSGLLLTAANGIRRAMY